MSLPPGYVECVQKLLRAAQQWSCLHGTEGLGLTLPPEGVMIVAPLSSDDAILRMFTTTELGVAFLKHLDASVDHEASVDMACFVLRDLGFPVTDWEPSKVAALSGGGNA